MKVSVLFQENTEGNIIGILGVYDETAGAATQADKLNRELTKQGLEGINHMVASFDLNDPQGLNTHLRDLHRLERTHVVNVRARNNEYFIVLSDESEVPWAVWNAMTTTERRSQ